MSNNDKLINQLVAAMEVKYKQDLSVYDEVFLYRMLQNKSTAKGSLFMDDYLALIESDKDEALQFIQDLDISYSEFFRNAKTFDILKNKLLPILLEDANAKKEPVRIWSAACAGGHEPYSIAILFEELAGAEKSKQLLHLFASDRSASQIKQAKRGNYSWNEVKSLPEKWLTRYFIKKKQRYEISDHLIQKVFFSQHDLFDKNTPILPESLYGDMDIIFCCNVLYYYSQRKRTDAIHRLLKGIKPGGYLVTSDVERDLFIRKGFSEIFPESAIFKKT